MTSKDLKNKLVTQVVDSNGEVIYDFTDVIDAIKNKIDTLEKENQELKEKNKMLEENEETVLTTLEIAVQENTKLKKAFEILKHKFEIKGVKEYLDGYVIDTKLYYIGISQEEYELLKGVLE